MFIVSVRNTVNKPLTTTLNIDTGVLAFDGSNAGANSISITVPPLGLQQVTLQAQNLNVDTETQVTLDNDAEPLTLRVKPAAAPGADGNGQAQPQQVQEPGSEFHAPAIAQP